MTTVRRTMWLALLLLLALASCATAAPGLTTGFSDGANLLGSDSSNARLQDAVQEGAGTVRLFVDWAAVAPHHAGNGFDPTSPSSPGYDWTHVDSDVRQLSAAGLRVVVMVDDAPSWAEGAHKPGRVRAGTWRPSPSALGAFALAAARRYSGQFADPLHPGQSLPRVRLWQGWNEPNLSYYLSPQWTRSGGRWVPVAPTLFRNLTNAFYKSVKSVSRSNFVLLAGTAPYGDSPGGQRIPPAQFDRFLFCEKSNPQLSPTRCPDPVHTDGIDHHPYGVGGPFWHALNPDDVAVPDVYKLTRILRAAQREHHVVPAGRKRIWVTEISWDTRPPDPRGVALLKQAHWCEQAMYVLWRQGVDTMLWLQLSDAAPIPSYATSNQGGLYFLNGRPKPSAVAFRFPFVTQRLGGSKLELWGRSPERGTLRIEVKQGKGWRVVWTRGIGTRQVFSHRIRLSGRHTLRAQVGSQTSLPWNQS